MLTQDVLRVTLAYMEGLNCPRSLTCALLARHGEWDQLTNMSVVQSHYCTAADYRSAAAATDFLRKYDGFDLCDSEGDPLDLEAETMKKWFWSEEQCFTTNRRFERVIGHMTLGSSDDERIYSLLERMRKNVFAVIGAGPPTTFDGRFGPGATASDMSKLATIPDKMSSTPTFTPNALFHLVPWMGTAWARACANLGRRPSSVRGNTFFSVPKTSRSRRGCGKEAPINLFYQLGLGRVMKRRLLRAGIDLSTGKSIHMQVACEASKTSAFCTVDLTSASDCLAYVLVKYLLPPLWFQVLDSLRSPFTEVGGAQVYLEKFSSMGNGFTFELETLVFLAAAQAVMQEYGLPAIPGYDVWVYGDDIIVPTEVGKEVIATLKFLGFTPNDAKTFIEGPFRESCGGDYWLGEAVRPFNLTEDPNEPHKLISLANGIRRFADQDPVALWDNLRRSWFATLDLLPLPIRCLRGPQALGDIVVHDDESRWRTRWRSSIRYVQVWRPARYRKVMFEGFAYDVQMAAALYGVDLQGPTALSKKGLDQRFIVPRDGVVGYKVGWVPYS